jgi:hypothetical protein
VLSGEQALPRVDQRAMCPKCGSLMWLTRIEPYLSDRDMRTFECDGCRHSEMIAVKYSNAALSRSAWLKNLRDTRLSPPTEPKRTPLVSDHQFDCSRYSRMLARSIGAPGGCHCFGAIDQIGIWAQARLYAARASTHFPGRRLRSSTGE